MKVRNIGILTVANGANALLAFAASVIAARLLGPGDFGKLSVLMATSAFLALSLDFGMNQILTGRIALRKGTALFRDILRVRTWLALLVTLVASGLAVTAVLAGPRPRASLVVQWAAVATATAWQLVFTTQHALAQGSQHFRRLAFLLASANALRVVLVAFFGFASARYEAVLAGYLLPSVITGVYTATRHRADLHHGKSYRLVRKLLPTVLLAGVTVTLTALMSRIGIWMVALVEGSASAGAYAVAFQTASLVLVFASALSLSLLPEVAVLDRSGRAHDFLASYLRRALPALGVMVVATAGLSLLVPAIFGQRFVGTGPTTFLLMVGFLASALNSPFYLLYVSRMRYGFLIKIHLVQVVLLTFGCLVLVPLIGFEGAAVAEAIMRVSIGASFVAYTLHETRRRPG